MNRRTFFSLFRAGTSSRAQVNRPRSFRPVLEPLEDRRLLASDGALVCVAGSLYLVGEARRMLAGEEM